MDIIDMDYYSDLGGIEWLYDMNWGSTVWENKQGNLIDIRKVSSRYATNIIHFIEQGLMKSGFDERQKMEIRTSRFMEKLEERAVGGERL